VCFVVGNKALRITLKLPTLSSSNFFRFFFGDCGVSIELFTFKIYRSHQCLFCVIIQQALLMTAFLPFSFCDLFRKKKVTSFRKKKSTQTLNHKTIKKEP